MASLWELLGFGRTAPSESDDVAGRTASVRRIVASLEALDPERARYVAAFAYLLSRVANADLEISGEETAEMESLVRRYGDLPEDQALLVVAIAKNQNRMIGHTDDFQVAREFREISTRDQREELLHCLFAVSAADDSISAEEERQVGLIAAELGFSQKEMVEVRSHYNDKRSVIQRLDGRGG